MSGHFLDQVNGQQTVFQISTTDFDMIGKVKLALEAAVGDTAIEIGFVFAFVQAYILNKHRKARYDRFTPTGDSFPVDKSPSESRQNAAIGLLVYGDYVG